MGGVFPVLFPVGVGLNIVAGGPGWTAKSKWLKDISFLRRVISKVSDSDRERNCFVEKATSNHSIWGGAVLFLFAS